MTSWLLLFWLLTCIFLIPPLKQWINIHTQGVAFLLTGHIQRSRWLFWLLLLPGTLLHEFSHWLIAHLLQVKVSKFSLHPQLQPDGNLQMGAVQIEKTDPFRHSLIGLAPLIFGSGAVLLIAQFQLNLDTLALALQSGNLENLLTALTTTMTGQGAWLWLYLIFAISNAMFPSPSDRQSWRTVLLYSLLALLVSIGLGYHPTLSPNMQQFGLTLITHLLSALTIAMGVDLLFISLIICLETFLAWVTGRRVLYNYHRSPKTRPKQLGL